MNQDLIKKREGGESISEAMMEISNMIQTVMAEGAGDEEIPFFQALSGQLYSGRISPQEALKQARAKQAARGNYH